MLRNLALYRSSLVFLLGVAVAAALAIRFEGGIVLAGQAFRLDPRVTGSAPPDIAEPRAMTDEDRHAADVAWAYFAEQTQPETGLVNSTAGFPSTTLWDQGGYILALVAARELAIIDSSEFSDRAARVLHSLRQLELLENGLPNKVYDTRSLAMVNYRNEPVPGGIGWSALDIARMLVALRVLDRRAPEFSAEVREIIGAWALEDMAVAGELMGGARDADGLQQLQEGRIGYEQYAARAAALWGLDTSLAMIASRNMQWQTVSGVEVPTDTRSHTVFTAITPVVSEPWLLEAFELGLNTEGHALAAAVFDAQIARGRETGQTLFVTEDHLDQDPYFVYSSVFANGQAWAVIDESGGHWPQFRTLSTKATIGWDVLFRTAETQAARARLAPLADTSRGWAAGLYEADGSPNRALTLNTNAVILEAVHFGARGPLWSLR